MKSDAWETLFKKYYNEALLYVFSFCHNRTLSEDIVQEAYARALRSIDEEKDGFKFWLFKVCRNCYFDYHRKAKKVEYLDGDVKSDDIVETVIRQEEYRALYKAISLLQDNYKEAVLLYYFDGLSVREIADITGNSTDNVKIQLYRARLKLKELLEKKI